MGILTILLSHNSNNRKLKVIIRLLQKICSTTSFQTKRAFGAVHHVSPFSFKSQHIDFAGFAKGTSLVFLNTITQYSRFTKTLVVNLNRAAIIFPFHYFW